MTLPFMKRSRRLLSLFALALLAAPTAFAQYIPYFGKNKVNYDRFAWRVYKSPHFEVYYYPEFEQHLGRLVSYLESSYQHISSELKHEIQSSIPVVFYKTHSEFEADEPLSRFHPGTGSGLHRADPQPDGHSGGRRAGPSSGPDHSRAGPRLRVRPHSAGPDLARNTALGR